jgi:hypothetical protein
MAPAVERLEANTRQVGNLSDPDVNLFHRFGEPRRKSRKRSIAES